MSRNEFVCDCEMVHKDVVEKVQSEMMSEGDFIGMSEYFKVLGNNTRVKIVWALYKSDMCVCDLANLLSMTKSAISHQLKILRDSNIIKFEKKGKVVYYSLYDDHIIKCFENASEHIKE